MHDTHEDARRPIIGRLVGVAEAYRLPEQHNLPPIEVDAALYNEPVERSGSVLAWVDAEELKLTRERSLIKGPKLYRLVRSAFQ